MHDSAFPRGNTKGEEQHASASGDSRNGESYHALDIKGESQDTQSVPSRPLAAMVPLGFVLDF